MMKIRSQSVFVTGFLFAASILGLSSCSSGPEVHRSNYASLSQQKFFESPFEDVWRAIDRTFENYKVLERDPAKVTPTELRNLKKRSLETDWIYGESRDKYHTFTFANRAPIKKALQTRLKYTVLAEAKFPGVVVTVTSKEEIEMLKEDGSSRGWDDVSDDERDSSRGAEILAKIEIALHSAPNL
jgi:hypothetical protein